ncbi:hypothetical protein PG985_009631 [Apiospora marii]|uniref:uncharacterized protein n=1 Tax=Apiospora marii TaxID=335849 RepID=UPI00312DC80C
MQLPVELICEITSYLVADDCVCPGDEIMFNPAKPNPRQLHDLASLRLVSKKCCGCATPLLFRRVDVVSSIEALKEMSRLLQISTSRLAGCVRRVDFGIARPDDLPYPADTRILQPVLKTLSVALLDLDLPKLQELHINYPFAHDLARLLHDESRPSRNHIAEVFRRLRHLGIHLTESKSQIDWPYPQRHWYDAPSNRECVGNVIELVALAENLQSLDLGSCEAVDLDGLAAPRSWRLRSLKLQGTTISPANLMRLIGGSRDTLESVLLLEVEFKSGTWEQVLQAVARIEPSILFNFQMHTCMYSVHGTSAELYLGVDGAWEYDDDPPPIITH